MNSHLKAGAYDSSMFRYSAEAYTRLVENTKNLDLREYMDSERLAIRMVERPRSKTFVDLGAGYGRLLPVLAPIARNVISIEANYDLFAELERRSARLRGSTAILDNVGDLPKTLRSQDVKNPVFLLMQNTLGVLAGVTPEILLLMIKEAGREYGGELLLSLFRKGALESVGMEIYGSISEMVGEPETSKSDLRRGLFRSSTGYASKWWSDGEINTMLSILGGEVVEEISSFSHRVIHVSFGAPQRNRFKD